MALNTPISISVSAFDALHDQTFGFMVQGGDQVVGNILTIVDNDTSVIVYQNEVESYVYQQVLPAGTLQNDKYYLFYFQTKNINGDVSSRSSSLTFRTFKTPTLRFTNIPPSHVEGGSYLFEVEYNQESGELLNYLYIYLYDSDRTEIGKSEMFTSQSAPPLTFSYQATGLVDNENYFIRALGETIYGTVIDTGYVSFNVDYVFDGSYFEILCENHPNSGYVSVRSNVSEIDGQTWDYEELPTEPVFVEDNTALLLENGDYIEWNDGFGFNNNKFIAQKWWSPIWWGRTIKCSDLSYIYDIPETTYVEVELKRGIPQGETHAKDYCLIKAYDNGRLYGQMKSNYVEPLNNMSNVTTFLRVDDGNITFQLINLGRQGNEIVWNGDSDVIWEITSNIVWVGETESSTHNEMDWDGNSNVEYGRITDMFWEDEPEAMPVSDVDIIPTDYDIKQMRNVRLYNSVVRTWWMSHDFSITEALTTEPVWDGYTIMLANFNYSLSAGNVEWLLNTTNNVKVKRRLKGDNKWITLHDVEIHDLYDTKFTYKDYYAQSGQIYEYALVPSMDDDEKQYFTTTVKTYYDGLFIADKDKCMKLKGNYLVQNSADNIQLGVVQPYNQIYPVIIKNPNVLYRTISVQGDVLGMSDEECVTFELTEATRPFIVGEKREWDKFLCNGKTKIIKDWNGNILMGQVTTVPSYTYNQQSGNGMPTMSFGMTEVGDYDSQEDLFNHGLINAEH